MRSFITKNKLLITILAISSLIAGIYISSEKDNTEVINTRESTIIENVETSETAFVVPEDWLTYVDPDYGFSFKYPDKWVRTYSSLTNYSYIDLRKQSYGISFNIFKESGINRSLANMNVNLNDLFKYEIQGIELYRIKFEDRNDFRDFGPSTLVELFTLDEISANKISNTIMTENISVHYEIPVSGRDYGIQIKFDPQNIDLNLIKEIDNIISTIKWAK